MQVHAAMYNVMYIAYVLQLLLGAAKAYCAWERLGTPIHNCFYEYTSQLLLAA